MVNRQWFKSYGYTAEELSDTPFSSLLSPEDAVHFDHTYLQASLKKGESTHLWHIRHKNGILIPVRIQTNMLTGTDGAVFYQFACMETGEGELERYREIFRRADSGFAVYLPIEGGEGFSFCRF
jgi:PAS domain S-box-containing protein